MERVTIVRHECNGDAGSVRCVHETSFPSSAEAILVDLLRELNHLSISLVATVDDVIVGHVAFSPVRVPSGACGLGLAPLAVVPEFRRRGIASELVSAGLRASAAAGCSWVVVLGGPEFYGRFGFAPASEFGLYDEYGGGRAFQVMELLAYGAPRDAGMVRYGPEFASL